MTTPLQSAHVRFCQRSQHGVEIVVRPQPTNSTFRVRSPKIDVYGDIYKGMPSAAEQMASFLLPLELTDVDYGSIGLRDEMIITIGKYQVSHNTVMEKLGIVVQNGDPMFMVEILGENNLHEIEVVCQIPTRASLILSSLSGNPISVICSDPLPPSLKYEMVHRHTTSVLGTALKWMRWWLFALMFAIGCWFLLINPELLQKNMPQRGLFHNSSAALGLDDSLPPVPSTMTQAFALGQLNQNLLSLEAMGGSLAAQQAVLDEATRLLSRRTPVTATDLHSVYVRIASLENGDGKGARVRGLFSFVNLLWLVAILGVTVSIGPALVHILKPLRSLLVNLCKFVFTEILIPLAIRLHKWGVFEMLFWIVAWFFVFDGVRFFPQETGTNITLTGMLLVLPCFAYSTFLHGLGVVSRASRDTMASLGGLWYSLLVFPLAVHYQSNLMAYICVMAFYSSIGFSIACFGLCYMIGFTSRDALQRCIATSALLLIIVSSLRIFGLDRASPAFVPFKGPISVFGSFVLFLGLLIFSSKYYNHRTHGNISYLTRNLMMLVALTATLYIGFVYGMNGMANTGTTFLFLWLVEKYLEIASELKLNGWLLLLSLSGVLYYVAMYLNSNPLFLASLFSAEVV